MDFPKRRCDTIMSISTTNKSSGVIIRNYLKTMTSKRSCLRPGEVMIEPFLSFQ